MPGALRTGWYLTRQSVLAFIEDGAISRGAAIAFYAITSLGPILLIVVAVAGVAYGEDAARGVLLGKLSGLMGEQSASFLQAAIKSAWRHGSGTFTTLIGVVSLLLTATGLFSEMQTALNAIWNVTPQSMTMWSLVRDRLLSLALVLGLALVLILTAALAAAISALQTELNRMTPLAGPLFQVVDLVVSYAILTGMVAAIYKVLPDRDLHWSDVMVGAAVTAALITIGKLLIGLYIGHTGIASSYGAAGSVVAVLLWIYYSAQTFLLGAEFTSVQAEFRTAVRRSPDRSGPPNGPGSAAPRPTSPPPG